MLRRRQAVKLGWTIVPTPLLHTVPFAQLQAFLAVTRHRSFSAAAREIGVSRSAVSQSVRLLEEQLNIVLLTRTTRSVALTDLGRRLVEGVAPGVSQVVSALNEVGAPPGEAVGRRATLPRTAGPSGRGFCFVTSALPFVRKRPAPCMHGSSSADARRGACRFEGALSATTAHWWPRSPRRGWALPTPLSRWSKSTCVPGS